MPLAIDSIYVHQPVDEADLPLRPATPRAPPDADMPQLQPYQYWPAAVRQPVRRTSASPRRSSPLVTMMFLVFVALFLVVEIFV